MPNTENRVLTETQPTLLEFKIDAFRKKGYSEKQVDTYAEHAQASDRALKIAREKGCNVAEIIEILGKELPLVSKDYRRMYASDAIDQVRRENRTGK